MSAFFVHAQTVHDTVAAWCSVYPQPRSQRMLDTLGRGLLAMNAEAIRQRYPSVVGTDEDTDMAHWAEFYVYRHPAHLSPAQAAMSACCLRYQCSEGDVPETWPAFAELSRVCDALGEPTGYDDATWGREADVAA